MKILKFQILSVILLVCLSNVFAGRSFLKARNPGVADNIKFFLGFFQAAAEKHAEAESKAECKDVVADAEGIKTMKTAIDAAKAEGSKSLANVAAAYGKTTPEFKNKFAKCMKAWGVEALEPSLAVMELADLNPFLEAFGYTNKKGEKVKMTVNAFVAKGYRNFIKGKMVTAEAGKEEKKTVEAAKEGDKPATDAAKDAKKPAAEAEKKTARF